MTAHDLSNTAPVSTSIPRHVRNRSPRSSDESSPRTPTSPFLHNLSRRFRKGSDASTFSTASETPAQHPDPVDKAETAESAKRFVLSVVRNDWEWPPSQQPALSGVDNVKAAESKHGSYLGQRSPVAWRTRFEGASDLDLDLSPVTPTSRRMRRRSSDPYKFESPDAIATAIQEQRVKRKRATAEETTWNEGLRTWMERRDAWTAAQSHKPRTRLHSDTNSHRSTCTPTSIHDRSSQSSDESKPRDHQSADVNQVSGDHIQHVSLAVDDAVDPEDTTEEDTWDGPYLPICPPLFPMSHTLRASIKPAAYPTIYSKVVVQGLTPNVPIPLGHMVSALVDGWKAEGQWPPQTLAEQQTHALLKRAKGSKKGETAFQKWRKEREAATGGIHGHRGGDIVQDGFVEELIDEGSEKKSFRRSISGAVKKVFGIHHDADEDGGLSKLGLSFGTADAAGTEGLLLESHRVAEDNVLLNKALLEHERV